VSAVPEPALDACPLCAAPVAPLDRRCPECGYALDGVGSRPGLFSRAALVWSLMGLLVVYLVTLGIVGLTHQ
jgi:predicted amidophosphoribosyltransferase